VTHPVDAFHPSGQPGLRLLHPGQSLTSQVSWRSEAVISIWHSNF